MQKHQHLAKLYPDEINVAEKSPLTDMKANNEMHQ